MTIESIILFFSSFTIDFLIPLIVILFLVGLAVLFKRHYLVESEHAFATSLHRRTHELIDLQYKEERTKEFSEIVWYVLKKAANETDSYKDSSSKKGNDLSESNHSPFQGGPFSRKTEFDASAPFGSSGIGSKKNETPKPKLTFKQVILERFNSRFNIEKGIQKIIDNTLEQTMYYKLSQPAPNFLNIATYAFTYNPYFQRIWKWITIDTANSLLKTWHEIIVMIGILGTFIGFFLAFQNGGDLKGGIGIAITSSIVGMGLGVIFMVIEKSFTDDNTAMNSVEIYKDSLELIWNNSKALYEE